MRPIKDVISVLWLRDELRSFPMPYVIMCTLQYNLVPRPEEEEEEKGMVSVPK